MVTTRHFKETIQKRALNDAIFRKGLLEEAIEAMLKGDGETGKMLLRDYINATIGFEKLAKLTHKSPKSLMRMLSSTGNPTTNNFFSVLHTLQQTEGLHFKIRAHH